LLLPRLLLSRLLLLGALVSVGCTGSTGGDGHHDHDHGGGAGRYVVDPAEVTVDVVSRVEVRDGTVVGGVPRFEVPVGGVVAVTVVADTADQVHLHVYDVVADVGPGVAAELVVRAEVPGVFEAELHGSGLRVFELEVS